jgi:hypothetical protein
MPKISKRKEKYLKYLKSDEWAEIRDVVIKKYGSICQCCLEKTKYPQVHHKTYENLYNEEPEDLTLLCKKCHEKKHNVKNNKPRYRYNKKNFKKLMRQNAELKIVINSAIKIKSLWLPGEDWKKENVDEALALMTMLRRFEKALSKYK